MKKNICTLSLIACCCILLNCQESKIKITKSEIKELVGMDYKEIGKNAEIYLKDKCSPYVFYRKDNENDSLISYLFMSDGKCLDACYEIVVNKKTNKIIEARIKNMA